MPGKGHFLFFPQKKEPKKLSAAPFATKVLLLLWFFVAAKAKAEFIGVLWSLLLLPPRHLDDWRDLLALRKN
ncbi:MAG TPA: hypothetical protein VF273_02820 [Pelobium sp.]